MTGRRHLCIGWGWNFIAASSTQMITETRRTISESLRKLLFFVELLNFTEPYAFGRWRGSHASPWPATSFICCSLSSCPWFLQIWSLFIETSSKVCVPNEFVAPTITATDRNMVRKCHMKALDGLIASTIQWLEYVRLGSQCLQV